MGVPSRLPWSAASSGAKRTNDNIHENNTEAISGSTITTSWGERDENNTENISGSTITTSWVVQASEHHGASAEQHTNENNTENVSGSTITTSWVVQASEHARQRALSMSTRPLGLSKRTIRSVPAAPSYWRPCKACVGYQFPLLLIDGRVIHVLYQ